MKPPQQLPSPSSFPRHHHHPHPHHHPPFLTITSLLLLTLTLLFTPSSHAVPLSLLQTYSSGPITLSSHATLHHSVDLPRNSIKLGLIFSDAATLSDTAAWVGIGIGEATSGSMLGADIVTAEFMSGTYNNTCVLTDRYVPWDAYPATPYPVKDGCGRTSDWTLVSCIRNPMEGIVVLEVVRPVTVEQGNDVHDRSIVPYENAFLYAYGGDRSIDYHGSMNRKSTQITFYTPASSDAINKPGSHDNDTDNPTFGFTPPADAHGYFDLVVTDYAVPHGSVTYACTSKAIPLPASGGDRMIIAAEPIIKSERAGEHGIDEFESPVHHFTVYVCGGDRYARKTATTVACNGGNTGTSGPLANPDAKCSTFVFGYAKGVTGYSYPEETGILVDGRSKKYVIMEIHFDNPSDPSLSQQQVIDSSGVRLYYTDVRRRHILGSIQTGDALVTLRDTHVENGLSYQFSCPSICTSRFSQPVQLVSSFLHMHRTGRQASTNVFFPPEADGETKLKTSLNQVSFWSDKFQHATRVYKQVELKPGEQIQTSCTYDTTKRPNVTFGFSTEQEMCMDFVMYYPMQIDPVTKHEINLCAFARFRGVNRTACFDAGRIREVFRRPRTFPQASNPAFFDHVGAATNFSTTGDSHIEANVTGSVCL